MKTNIPNPAVKITQEERDLMKHIESYENYDFDGMKVLGRCGNLRKAKRIFKSLMEKGIVEYDGFDPENICTKNKIRRGINWYLAVFNWNKENKQ